LNQSSKGALPEFDERREAKRPPFFLSLDSHSIAIIILLSVLWLIQPAFAQSPISGFNPASLVDRNDSVFIDATTFWADNALPLQAIFFDKGWEGPFRPKDTNNLDVFWKTDTGIIYHGWRLAGFYRGELFIKANRGSVEILRIINLKQELPVNKNFDIDIKANGFSAIGIELSRGFRVGGLELGNGLTIGFTARYMKGEKIQEGTLKGNVIPTAPKEYDFDLGLDYIYDENFVYERRDTIPGTGDGYSFDIGMKYDFNESLSAELLFRDIMGRIYWKDVPYTTANARSDIKYYDEDGYMVFKPTISGYEAYKDFNQKIPLKTDIIVTYKKDPFMISPAVIFIEDRPFYWIDIGYKATENLSFDVSYNINYNCFSIGTAYKKALLRIYADNIDFKKAMVIGLNLSLVYEW
jgi:hypothetical protein